MEENQKELDNSSSQIQNDKTTQTQTEQSSNNKPFSKDKRVTDSYLESLQFLAKYYQKNVSQDSLAAGILAQGKKMDLEAFIKSSSRIGLICKRVQRKVQDISQLALPSLLILKKGRACVLLDIDLENDKVKVFIPGLHGETVFTIERLLQEYTGTLILIKNDFKFKNQVHKKNKS